MLSRNNWSELFRQQEPKKQRFAFKKLTIGFASVLIGFTFMGVSASANSSVQTTTTTPTETARSTNSTAGSQTQANGAKSAASSVASSAANMGGVISLIVS